MARLFGRSEVQGNLRLHPIGLAVLLLAPFLLFQVSLGQAPVGSCGSLGGGAVCQDGYCCSTSGYCGTTSDYCGAGNCQSQCPPSSSPTPGPPTTPTPPTTPSPGSGVGSIVTSAIFDTIFPPAQRDPLYTYDGFITATNFYSAIGTTGDSTAQSREVAALLAHISHETGALSKVRETNPTANYCDQTSTQYPCAPNQQYYGRGPLQLSWNYNYGQAGAAIGQDLLKDPDLVATNSAVSFETALWFWTTAQAPKPSCHDVMDGTWSPSSADVAANRQPGFGVTILVINGGQECGSAPPNADGASARISLYQSICGTLSVDPGSNLDCASMSPF